MLRQWLAISLALFPLFSFAQSGYISGHVLYDNGQSAEFVNVGIIEYPETGTSTDENGHFFLRVPADKNIRLSLSFVGYNPVLQRVRVAPGDTLQLTFTLRINPNELAEVIVKNDRRDEPSVIVLDPEDVEWIPTPSGNFESILKTIGLGISTSGGELSSQYSVRGGNFDENLVYVNDFEIYRPFLVRSGQQEGLSFINPDLVQSVSFSSGGFEARYGDKLSSVLDVKYKEVDSFAASLEVSLLGANIHAEGNLSNRLTFLAGVRQKSNQYLLKGLNTEGDYQPSFTDAQALLAYRLAPRWDMEWIGNYSRNRYIFFPESRVTSIGTVNNVKELEVFFDGQEDDSFTTLMSGISATYTADSNRFRMKFLASAYHSSETETFDIIGDYYLYQVENDLGQDNFGERLFGLGYGTYQNFGRNYLTATVANVSHLGFYFMENHFLEWGLKYQREEIFDQINEWERQDSALYSLPYDPSQVLIKEVLKTDITLNSNRYSGFLQDTWVIKKDSASDMNLTGGLRFHYWDVNNEFLVSPRAQFSIKPRWERNVIFKAAAGLYHQPPFYRELRNFEGEINTDLKAQKSAHFVLGGDYVFKIWDREFRLISEAYYKEMWDLVPYDVEDVKIRYYGENRARGYATGLDFRLNGEFVENAESWFTLSIMETREDIHGDFYIDSLGNPVEVGYLSRPTDQRVNVGILFQDYLPKNDNFKMHLNLLFGTGLPFGPPNSERFRNALRIPPYRRVDIGFSALLYERGADRNVFNFLSGFESAWASLEVFNLLEIRNTVSHIWIKDNTDVMYAFENHLTGRRINLRVILKI